MIIINPQQSIILNYSHTTINNHQVKGNKSYNRILQNRLHLFNDLISSFYPKAIKFFHNHLKDMNQEDVSQYETDLLLEILAEYNSELKNKVQMIQTLISDLNGKKVDEKTFKFLMGIIAHQEEVTREIVSKDMTIDRIESVFNHIKELPYYLESDLELNKLAERENVKSIVIKNKNEEDWKVISDQYNLNMDKEIYRIRI